MKKAPAGAPGKGQLTSHYCARLHYSSKQKPCPICSRTKDGDCRWRAEWIACHTGAAANDLWPGQTIEALGQSWYLSRTNGGHSGTAHIYRPHRPGQRQRQHRSKRNTDTLAGPLPIARHWLKARGRSQAGHRRCALANQLEAGR